MRKKHSPFGSLLSFDTFNIFSDALFASGAAMRFAKRRVALHERIGKLLDENMAGVSPEKYAENTKKIEALLTEMERPT